jgi:hypothetical protein
LVDAGITNTVHPGYFTHDKVLDKLNNIDKISFVAFPYEAKMKFMGLNIKRCVNYQRVKVNKVCRGGFFGGPKEELVSLMVSIIICWMNIYLKQGYMGTEESLFTII